MNIIDGYPLILPPCGIKSFLIAYLEALSRTKKRQYVILVPECKGYEKHFDTQAIASLENNSQAPWSVKRVSAASWMMKLLLALSHNASTFRRYFLFYWEFYLLPRYIASVRPETVFHPYQVVSDYQTTARKYVVVHDVFHWIDMGRYNLLQRYFYGAARKGCRNAAKIITISEFSKKQIMHCLSLPEEAIAVCYEGVDGSFLSPGFGQEQCEKMRTRYNLPEKFIFSFISERMYKKNNIAAVQILHALRQSGDTTRRLVFLGGTLHTNKAIEQYISANSLQNDVTFVSRLDNASDLKYLYHLADFFVFLSFEEGFGLPPLETLACGSFPLVSSTSSLSELYGNVLPTFDPHNPESVASYILGLAPQERKRIIGEARSTLLTAYNWDRILPRYLEIMFG